MSLTEITRQAFQLTVEEQVALRNSLHENTHPIEPEFDQHWLEVVKQRRENVRSGKSRIVSLEEVMDELQSGL
ncbi:MAG: addiction module protein [Pleurocapsa sp. SU_196_0]|nr:addiction module protein [Pleurocapsa sp. SU_196_0]